MISYHLDTVPIILASAFLRFCVGLYEICLFFSVVLCWSNVNQRNEHVSTKTFGTATIFWEKGCIFWQNCKSANIFRHDYKILASIYLLNGPLYVHNDAFIGSESLKENLLYQQQTFELKESCAIFIIIPQEFWFCGFPCLKGEFLVRTFKKI